MKPSPSDEKKVIDILSRIQTGTPLTVTNKERLRIWFVEALTTRAEEAYKDGFARGQEKKASCVCSTKGPCGLHQLMIEEDRREEREKYRKLLDKVDLFFNYDPECHNYGKSFKEYKAIEKRFQVIRNNRGKK